MKVCRAIRGATTADSNTAEDILEATAEMLRTVITLNDLSADDFVSIFFTTTRDLNATFPAVAARELGLDQVALMCAHEMDVQGALGMCVRALIHVNTEVPASEIKHVYLKGAVQLRPEWGREPVGEQEFSGSREQVEA